jgi:hypothetical protein
MHGLLHGAAYLKEAIDHTRIIYSNSTIIGRNVAEINRCNVMGRY